MIKVVIKEPSKPPYIAQIGSSLEEMQKVVKGHIEIVPAEIINGGDILPKDKFLLVFDEEGKLKDLEPNIPIFDYADCILGKAFICKADGDELVGLTNDEAALVMGLFKGKEG